jgi:ABC-2 type transport system ATP-binding protein
MIEVKNLSKNYGSTIALNNVSFTVGKPEIVGFLGPNGAGKTTAMKIITTYLAPTSGTVTVNGIDVMENPLEVRKYIGYLPEKAPLYDDMVVRDYLKFVGEARQIDPSKLGERMDWVIDACGIEPVLHKKIHMLSKGYRQRVGLGQALIHDPEILILDEPTTGLDPLQIRGIRQLIRDLARSKTIILSTHILPEITAVSERIIVINQGEKVADGKYNELKKTVVGNTRLIAMAKGGEKLKKEIGSIKGVVGCDIVSKKGDMVKFSIEHKEGVSVNERVSDLFKERNIPLITLCEEEVSLEELFISLTEKKDKKEESEA